MVQYLALVGSTLVLRSRCNQVVRVSDAEFTMQNSCELPFNILGRGNPVATHTWDGVFVPSCLSFHPVQTPSRLSRSECDDWSML